MPDLPVDIDATYPDDNSTPVERKLHQQHHDALHARYNEENANPALDGQTDSDFTALGVGSGRTPPGGNGSTLIGTYAGGSEEGGANTFVGDGAGAGVISGSGNVSIGRNTGPTDGAINDSVCIGANSSTEDHNTTAIGQGAVTTGLRSMAIGWNASTGGDDAIAIGPGVYSDPGEIRLAHVRFGHVTGTDWEVEIDGVTFTITVTP